MLLNLQYFKSPKMAKNCYILKPLSNENGKRDCRLEIDWFLLDNEMTNLFLVALAALEGNSPRQLNNERPD